jgi:formylglycine-generating enzyme required for sulfatase activity
VGIDLDDKGPLEFPGTPKFGVSFHKANAWITPTLEFAVETKGFAVQRAAIQVRQDFEGTLIPELSYRPVGTEKEKEWNVHPPMKKLVLVGFIYAVPVWMDYTYTTKVKLDAKANVAAMLRFGWSRNASLSAGASYVKDASPRVSWSRSATLSPLTVEPVSLSLGGTVKAKVSLVPQLDVRVESLLGFYMNADPREEFEITADGWIYVSGLDGKIQMSPGGHATLIGGFFADLNAGLSIIGVNQDYLPAMDPFRIYTKGWELEFPEPAALAFAVPATPQAVSVALGGSLNLAGTATGGDGTIVHQWLHNRILIPGQISRQLTIPKVTSGNAGSYTLRARAGTEMVISPAFTVTMFNPGTPLSGFAYIPAGPFQMGQTGIAEPVHTVQVSAFCMGKYEVTKEEWDAVRAWGLANGYTDLAAGNGGYASKGANHPVHTITWYDMVKWCNARSQKEGLTPCYMVSGATYKTGSSAPVCNWNANGYRLPTAAEWEKAARGGLSAQNFPWGNTITHSQANYYSYSSYAYDVSSTRGYHPTYYTGNSPYSSPVGSFAPNGYGLYDMAGNVWEWCWDWWGSYAAASQTNPLGATSGSVRVVRGGSWSDYLPGNCRVAIRVSSYPSSGYDHAGFRLARSAVP